MTRREMWLSVALIGAVALALRIWAASVVTFPIPEDTAYYYGVARNLVEGRGLVSDAVWSFQTPPLIAPRPAFEVWLPLPTLLAAIPMAIFGTGYAVAQSVSVIVGSLIPILAWRLALDVATERALPLPRARVLALGAGLTAAVELPLLVHSTLPDSTALFTLFVLIGCLLIPRILRAPRAGAWRAAVRDARLWALGLAIGLAALTRNEAVWLAVTWVLLVAWWSRRGGVVRGNPETQPGRWSAAFRLVAVPAAIAFAVFGPWLIRNTLVLGSPLPGQTVANALSITGFEIFAFADPPTLQRYLALGATRLLEMRLDGFEHNVMDVLVLPAFPVGVIGLVALPWFGRGLALRPLLLVSVITFTFTTLVFPVSTTWGTYLHAAGPAHVLLIVTCLFGLDALIVRVGVIRGWTRPVAWLGPALTVSCAAVFGAVFVMTFGAQAQETEQRYAQLPAALAAAGVPAAHTMGPVISDHPIWWAEAFRGAALGLPDESPGSVLKLARTFPGTRYLVLSSTHDQWPGILADGDPEAACFREVALPSVASGATPALATTRVFELVCP